MRRPLFILLLLTLLCACGNREKYERLLAEADSLNQNYIPFTTDSTMLDVVDYYDHHGTANERMRAYYLLGCVYRDLGEAPHALECYHDAIDCADTTAKDCDYKLLSRVFSQTGGLFLQEMALENALKSFNSACKYSMVAGDTLAYLLNYATYGSIYDDLNKGDSVISVGEKASLIFRQHNYMKESSLSLAPVIHQYIKQGQYEKAREKMDYYEKYSGIENPEEARQHSTYFYLQGEYYLQTNQLDVAEESFRKELSYSSDLNDQRNAYSGLIDVYKARHLADSIYKYTSLLNTATDNYLLSSSTETMQKMQSLYDYSRHQRLAEQKDREASNARLWLLFVSFIAILIIVLLCWLFVDIRHRNRHKTQLMRQKFVDDMIYLRTEHAKVIGSLEQRLKQYKKLSEIPNEDEIEAEMRNSAVVQKMQQIGSNKLRGIVTNDDWKAVEQIFDQCLPHFYSIFHNAHYTISREDYYLCMLIRMGFKPKEISNLTGYSSQTVTYIRSRLMQRVFNIEGGAKEFDEMLKCIR